MVHLIKLILQFITMPNTFYYLRGALSEQALLAKHDDTVLKAINRLLTGNYSQKNLEKLTGHAIYSFRVSDAARLLFTTKRMGDSHYLLVLDYLPTHDYHKSRFLRSGVLRHFLEHHEPDDLIFTSVSHEEAGALPISPAGETARGVALDFYHRQFIELTTPQQTALQVPLPAVISGVAGSGKSCIALSLLSSYLLTPNDKGETRRVLYVSQSERLVASMQEAWRQLPISVDTTDSVEFVSYPDLVRHRLDAKAPGLVNFASFEAWYQGPSKKDMYEELRICSGYDEASYLALGRRQSLVNSEERQQIYTLYQRYLDHQATFGYDPAFYTFDETNTYDCIVVDEAQDFSHGANKNLCRLVKNDQIIFCLDSHQQLYDRRSIRPYLLQQLGVDERHHVQLNTTHRCPPPVVAVANIVIALKHRLVGGIADKHAVTEVVGDNQLEGNVQFFTLDALHASGWVATEKGTHFAVVTQARYREQAQQLFQTDLVLTPEEIKGLEYPIVVAYQLCDDDTFKPIRKRLSTLGDKQPIHRAKTDAAEEFAPVLNGIYTSFMRTQQTLIICEKPSRDNACLLNDIQNLARPQSLSIELFEQHNTREDWLAEAKRHLKEGNHDIAQQIAARHQLGDVADDSNPPVKSDSLKSDISPQESKTEKTIITKTASHSLEAAFVRRLMTEFNTRILKKSLDSFELKRLLLQPYESDQTLLHFIQQDPERVHDFFALIVNDLNLSDKVAKAKLSDNLENSAFKENLEFVESLRKTLAWKKKFKSFVELQTVPLHIAATQGRADYVERLLRLGADVHKSNNDEETAVFLAAGEGHIDVLHILAQFNANINVKGRCGMTPALWASINEHIDALQVCIDYGADLLINDIDGFAPIHTAIFRKNLTLLRLLIQCRVDLNQTTTEGSTPVFLAAQQDWLEALELLHANGANLNISNNIGRTPALIAAAKGYENFLRKLHDYGADLNKKDNDEATPIFAAVLSGQPSTLKYLSSVVNINTPWYMRLDYFLKIFQKYANKHLLSKYEIPAVQINGQQLISMSLQNAAEIVGHPEIIAFLKSSSTCRPLTGTFFSNRTPVVAIANNTEQHDETRNNLELNG